MFRDMFINHNNTKGYIYGVYLLYEDIIKPGIVKLPGLDIDKLNVQYNSAGIFFHKDKNKDNFEGHYDPVNDEIHINFGKNVNKNEVEAMLSHELVHKEQHKRAGKYWQKQIKSKIDEISTIANLINKEKNPSKRIDLKKEYRKLLDNLNYYNPQEQMAYAMQFVKGRKSYGFTSANDIVQKYNLGNKFKKYVYMYWLIKNEI